MQNYIRLKCDGFEFQKQECKMFESVCLTI